MIMATFAGYLLPHIEDHLMCCRLHQQMGRTEGEINHTLHTHIVVKRLLYLVTTKVSRTVGGDDPVAMAAS